MSQSPPPETRTPTPVDRRRRRRYRAQLTARVHIQGVTDPQEAELTDLSAVGCFLRGADVSFLAVPGDELAFGCVTASGDNLEVALARGKVVRRAPGDGLGIYIEQANDVLDRLIGVLAATATPEAG
jgi:hypothetical protein